MSYEYLENRLAQTYIDMLPPFVPDMKAADGAGVVSDTGVVSAAEQERFYNIMKNLYRLAYDEPLLFVAALNEDDAFPNRFHKSSYGKPELLAKMKKFTVAVDGIVKSMFEMGRGKNVLVNKKLKTVLTKLGVDCGCALPEAWVWMSSREGASLTAFAHCLFDRDYPYTSDIYARNLGEAAFRKLETWMLDRGYKRFDIYNVNASDCKLSLTIANPAWSDDPPGGGFEYRIKHTGISARMDFYTATPFVVGLCIPNGMKRYLEAFDSMDGALKDFVAKQTRRCNACRYCVQTDKSGERPLANMTISHDANKHKFCTYFPGVNYNWPAIDDELAGELINMLSFMDRFAGMRP